MISPTVPPPGARQIDSNGRTWLTMGARPDGSRLGYDALRLLPPMTPAERTDWQTRYRATCIEALRTVAASWTPYVRRHYAPVVGIALPHLDAAVAEGYVAQAAALFDVERQIAAGYVDPARHIEVGDREAESSAQDRAARAVHLRALDMLAAALDHAPGHPLLVAAPQSSVVAA
jgi:hypothetical protein